MNSPNDLAYKSDGSLYFTDPPDGLPTQRTTIHKGVACERCLSHPRARQQKPGTEPARNQLQLVIKGLPQPNGICFSRRRNTYTSRIPARRSGCAIGRALFLDASHESAHGVPDGIRVDKKGNLYGAGWRRVDYFSRRETPRHNQSPRDREQCDLGRQRWQDALHYGQHQRVPHQVESPGSEELSRFLIHPVRNDALSIQSQGDGTWLPDCRRIRCNFVC